MLSNCLISLNIFQPRNTCYFVGQKSLFTRLLVCVLQQLEMQFNTQIALTCRIKVSNHSPGGNTISLMMNQIEFDMEARHDPINFNFSNQPTINLI